MELNKVYFYTATIIRWNQLLKESEYKDIIIDALRYLKKKQHIAIYAFVIMPNHFHIIWQMMSRNGREMPHASLMKYTSHQFLEKLRKENPEKLTKYKFESQSRIHQFWKRDSLPIELYTRKVFEQKLKYIHNNPLQDRWQLAEQPEDYSYSSAKFYATEVDAFGFLTHYSELF